eukprot:GEMP01020951.1.p1 GENE.GEMP01020951.1~~GEMP01020951.1.p1  ORF type:complete len:758 (+),score=217.91 GEMP01020951.1:40-2313(+)
MVPRRCFVTQTGHASVPWQHAVTHRRPHFYLPPRCFVTQNGRPAPWQNAIADLRVHHPPPHRTSTTPHSSSSSSSSPSREPQMALYYKAIRACASANKWRRALELAREALAATPLPSRAQHDDSAQRAVTSVLRAMATVSPQNAWANALDLLADLQRVHGTADVLTYNAALNVLAKSEAPGWCPTHILDAMRDNAVMPDAVSYNTALSALGKQQSWAEALEFFRTRIASPNRITYNTMLGAFGSEWQQSLAFLHAMPLTPDVFSYSTVLHLLARNGRWHAALHLLEQMRRTSSPVAPNVICVNSAMNACAHSGRWKEVLQLLRQVQDDATMTPDAVTFGACINACDKSGQWDMALRLLHSMPQNAVHPNAIVYGAAISACSRRGKWEHALQLFGHMRDTAKNGGAVIHPNAFTYASVISAMVNGAQWVQALRLLDQMEYTNVERNTIVYNAALSACDEGRKWAKAVKLLQRMKHDKVQPDVISFTAAISACEKMSVWREALSLLHTMKEAAVPPNALTYASALRSMPRGAKKADALGVVRAVQDAAERWALVGESLLLRPSGRQLNVQRLISRPQEAIVLLEALDDHAPAAFTAHVRKWIYEHVVTALRDQDLDALRRFELPNLGPFTREVLDELGLPTFDATEARSKLLISPKTQNREKPRDIRAYRVQAHVKSCKVDRVVKYGLHSPSNALPSIYIEHDRSQHAERQALLKTRNDEGVVELYVTHRPCVSCIAAMVAFQSPKVQLKVAFDDPTLD